MLLSRTVHLYCKSEKSERFISEPRSALNVDEPMHTSASKHGVSKQHNTTDKQTDRQTNKQISKTHLVADEQAILDPCSAYH